MARYTVYADRKHPGLWLAKDKVTMVTPHVFVSWERAMAWVADQYERRNPIKSRVSSLKKEGFRLG